MQGKRSGFQGNNRKRYACLLRYWQESDGNWRFTLEPVDGRSLPRRGFPHQAALLAYLKSILPDQDHFNEFDGDLR